MLALWREAGLGDACPVPPSILPQSWEGAGTHACRHPLPTGAVGAMGTLSHTPGWVLPLERGKTPGLRPLHLQPGPHWEAAHTQ